MSLVCIILLNLIYFAIRPFQFYLFAEIIHLRRITLLHDDLHHMLPLKLAISKHWHELYHNLHHQKLTSCRLLRSTLGWIL